MEKKEKKDQFIIAHIADLGQTETVLSYGTYLAAKLHKGLILLYICDPKYTQLTTSDAEGKMKDLVASLPESGVVASYAVLKGATREVVAALPTLLNAVVVVAQVDKHARRRSPLSRKSILKNFADCRAAFLVAQEPLKRGADIKDVAMAVDFKKESKDKFIWSSYFPRFFGAMMHILYYDYKDQFLHSKWYANMTQLHKLYSDLGISFQPHIIGSKSTYQDINALRYAAEQGYGLFVAVTTKEKDGLEFFIGVQEQRTVTNRWHIPILFLNPREDLYVLCD